MTHDFVLSCNIDDANNFVFWNNHPAINVHADGDYNRPLALSIV